MKSKIFALSTKKLMIIISYPCGLYPQKIYPEKSEQEEAMPSAVEFHNVYKGFETRSGQVQMALHSIDLTIRLGEFVGPTGVENRQCSDL